MAGYLGFVPWGQFRIEIGERLRRFLLEFCNFGLRIGVGVGSGRPAQFVDTAF
jgi:hypothetical protein